MEQDIRWKQRLQNYIQAFTQLQKATQSANIKPLSDLEKQGLIQAFEFTHELAWNVMKDYLVYQGITQITGSRDATREAFRQGLIEKGENWLEMIQSRNLTTHTYHESILNEMTEKIRTLYTPLLEEFLIKMKGFLKE